MPSNNELKADIAELDDTVDTAGLNNNQLAELKSDLLAKKKDAETETRADEPAPAPVAPAAAVAKGPRIAPGKSLTYKGRILTDGDEVTADLVGGAESLASHIERGYVVE